MWGKGSLFRGRSPLPAKAWWLGALLLLSLPADAFDLQGHRGARGLAPENTLAAFEKALEIGVTTLELDIAITADGVPVISHDPALNPAITRDARGRWLEARGPLIRSMTLPELQAFDVGRANPATDYGRQFTLQTAHDGQRIPALADLFRRVEALGARDVRFAIETKVFPRRPEETLDPDAFVTTLLGVIRSAGMTRRVIIQSFDWRTLQLVQQREPAIETVYLTSRGRNFDTLRDGTWTAGRLSSDYPSVAHMIKAAGGAIWAPNFNDLDADTVKGAQRLGLKVVPWTVNETPDMDRLITWGIDGLISDYPDRAREAMRRHGLPLPKPLAK